MAYRALVKPRPDELLVPGTEPRVRSPCGGEPLAGALARTRRGLALGIPDLSMNIRFWLKEVTR